MSWGVSEEAIGLIESLRDQYPELTEEIHNTVAALRSTYDTTENGLGAHSASIGALLDEVEALEKEASNPIKRLVLKLTRAAIIRRAHLENDPYQKGRSR